MRTLKRLAQKLSLLYVCYIHSDEIQSTVTELLNPSSRSPGYSALDQAGSVSLFPTA